MVKPVEIKRSPLHGKGVFATRNIAAGEVVEIAHVSLIHEGWELPEELATLEFPHDEEYFAICLGGVGSFFNHATVPNIAHRPVNVADLTKEFYALKEITKGEELCFYYHEGFDRFVNS